MNARLINSETSIREALRLRPRLAENLGAFGADPWERPGATLRDLFGNHGTLEKFLDMADAAPVPDPASAWEELPAAYLADYLTQNHRDFFLVTLPDIAGIFGDWDSLDPEITDLREAFDAFAAGLRAEIENEEARFIPRVLRYEACLRNPAVNPEFSDGSLRIAVAYRKSRSPEPHPGQLARLIDHLRDTHAAESGDPWADILLTRLGDFHAQFEEHERLESDVLFPMAMEMEKTLYNLSIAGMPRAGVGAAV